MLKQINLPQWFKRLIWPLVVIGILGYFIAIPIYKVGLWNYLGIEKDINPIVGKIVNKYLYHHKRALSKESSTYPPPSKVYAELFNVCASTHIPSITSPLLCG